MVRPVWHSSRHGEADTSETLQSDVMRFMAILGLCLVAIFALVKSLPMSPAEPVPNRQSGPEPMAPLRSVSDSADASPAPERESQPRVAPESVPEETTSISRQPSTEPLRAMNIMPVRPPLQGEISKPKPETMADSPERAVAPTPLPSPGPERAAAPAEQKGLVLRFASDTALLALVARRQVAVYAWVRDTTWRLSAERGVLSFAPATAPTRFHNMTHDTVPSTIVKALEAAARMPQAGDVIWGVTLPVETQRQLERLVKRHGSGALVIQADGRVRYQGAV